VSQSSFAEGMAPSPDEGLSGSTGDQFEYVTGSPLVQLTGSARD